ncbi:hypothetical protein [Devosia soli]|uniref:hypothetical protein n=1 Tax=Devosia soli TaxID=361041 RepID=UPI0013792ECF|nr:hypothetical protein [Devosia soli]
MLGGDLHGLALQFGIATAAISDDEAIKFRYEPLGQLYLVDQLLNGELPGVVGLARLALHCGILESVPVILPGNIGAVLPLTAAAMRLSLVVLPIAPEEIEAEALEDQLPLQTRVLDLCWRNH